MKKTILSMIAITSLILVSCGGGNNEKETGPDEEVQVSKKGDWTANDKSHAMAEIEKVRGDVEGILGDNTDDYIDCYMEKLEDNYDNFTSANADEPGCTKLAQECMEDIGPASIAGAWTEAEIAKAQRELDLVRGEIEGVLGDKTDDYLDCYLEAIMESYDNFNQANVDESGCTTLAQQCMSGLMN